VKLLALIAMIIDHFAEVFGWEGWNLIPFDANFLRYIGRISFPIFAFSLVAGWKYTHNREKYFSRIALFAFISQVPFSMALYMPNMFPGASEETDFVFGISGAFIPIAIFAVISYWYFALKRKVSLSLFAVAFAAFLPIFSVKIGYIWITTPDNLNVLYTLALGLIVMFAIDKVKEKKLHIVEYIWLFLLTGLLLLAYGTNADYGIGLMGIVLIGALYLTRSSKYLQSGIVALWGVIYYGLVLQNWSNAFATFVPAILILIYNQKRKNKSAFSKWIFYVLYPLHLLLIGVFNVYFKCF
jgi:hypothetical protein